MDPILIGYFPKSISAPPEFPGLEGVYSASECISPGPVGWHGLWRHNLVSLYDSQALAESAVRDSFRVEVEPDASATPPWRVTLKQDPFPHGRMMAYGIFPVSYQESGEVPLEDRDFDVVPLSDQFESLGYDVVVHQPGTASGFGCSPLSCNGRLGDLKVNRFCLFDDPAEAMTQARDIASSKGARGEPGPYAVVQVWRRRGGSLTIENCLAPQIPPLQPSTIEHAIRGALHVPMDAIPRS